MNRRLSILLGSIVALSACAAGPTYRTPKPDAPPQFTAQVSPLNASASHAASAAPVELSTWWRSLNDAELNSLVDRAVKSNLDVEIALDRLQQARSYEAVVVGHALPEVDASGAAGRGTGSDLTKGRAAQVLRSADDGAGLQQINTIVGFDAVWEIDLFGKFRREFQAVRAETDAARAARYDVLTAVIGDVVRAYVDLRGFQIRAGILHQASDVLRESLRIVNIRYERGITNELDVALATRELATLEGQIAPVEAEVKAAQYALAVLVGEYPENMVAELSKPDLIPTMPAGGGAGRTARFAETPTGHPTGGTRIGGGHCAHRRGNRQLVSRRDRERLNRQPEPGLGNATECEQAHLVLRTGCHLAAARFRRVGRANRGGRFCGKGEPRPLSKDDFIRCSTGRLVARCL